MLKLKKPTIVEIVPDVFLAVFDNQYDLAMTFCRFQEFYESPKFRGKTFTWHEFIKWYSINYGKNAFTYPKHWNGFNIPSDVLLNGLQKLNFNTSSTADEYTAAMTDIVERIFDIRDEEPFLNTKPFYLIGAHTEKDDDESYESLVKHEVAHGLYYTNKKYKREMSKLVSGLPKKVYNHLIKALKQVGYGKNVHKDEIQAYMSSGLRDNMNKKLLHKHQKQFKITLKKYYDGKIYK